MSSMTRPPVLVLWAGYPAGVRIVGSLRHAGFPVFGAHPQRESGGRSLRCLRPFRYPSPTREPDRLIEFVAVICRRHGIAAVIPVDEDIVRLLAERGDELPGVAVIGPDGGQYRTLCDKHALTETARALGLPTPDTVAVGADGPDGPWPALPSIVKPRISRSDVARPRLVETPKERDAYISELVEEGHTALVQERVAGARWVIHSVRAPGVFEHIAFRVLDEWPRTAGPACMMRPDAAPPGAVATVRRLLDHVDYRGPSGVSVIESGGRFFAHDANLRFGATVEASINVGFDQPRRAVEAVLGLGGEPFAGPPRRGTYIRFDLELRALIEALAGERDARAAWSIARRVAATGLSPRGRLDPFPLDPFWLGPLLARAAGRAVRPVSRAARAGVRPQGRGSKVAPSREGGGSDNAGPAGPDTDGGRNGDRHEDARAPIRR